MLDYVDKFCEKRRICADELVKFCIGWKNDIRYLGAVLQKWMPKCRYPTNNLQKAQMAPG